MKCDKCKNKEYCDAHSRAYDACVESGYAAYKPTTNYDRIISKTPEDLAKELVVLSDRCPDGVDCESVPHGRECFECWLDWLKQEEGNGNLH